MEYKHFSHHHTLSLYKIQAGQHFQCHGCHQPCHDSIFVCWKCSFFLHEHCGNANRYVKHPSHPPHPLILLPNPTYCSGSFLCNCCGAPGSTFSYSCALCEVDLHLNCAYLPPKVSTNSHQHEVYLSFRGGDSNECCKVCMKEMSGKQWSYFCDKPECRFRVHTFCATNEVKPGLYQDDEPEEDVNIPPPSSTSSSAAATAEELAEMFLQMQMAQNLNQIINSGRI